MTLSLLTPVPAPAGGGGAEFTAAHIIYTGCPHPFLGTGFRTRLNRWTDYSSDRVAHISRWALGATLTDPAPTPHHHDEEATLEHA